MSDLNDISSALNTKITGSDATGLETNPVNADANGNLFVVDYSDGPVAPGTQAARSSLAGGVYNSTLPTLTNAQQTSLQLDANGRLLIAAILVDTTPATQNITTQDLATTTNAIANGQSSFTGTPTAGSAASFVLTADETVVVQVTGTWTGTLQLEVSMDGGTTWYIRPGHQAGNSSSGNAGSFTANFTAGCNVGGWSNFRVRAIAAMTGTAVVRVVESINVNSVYIANAVRLTDANNTIAKYTLSGDIQTADIINVAGQYRAQSVTTSAAEALGAATILANRKMLTITPTNGTVYWGFNSSVTTSNGTPIFKNQTQSFAVGSSVHVFVIAGSTTDCRITEGS